MRFYTPLCLLLLAFANPATSVALDLSMQAVPANPTMNPADTTVSNPDGSTKNVKGPYVPVQIQFHNGSSGDDYTVSAVTFYLSSATDVLEEEAQRDMRRFVLEPKLKVAPGESAMTETFYLEGLPNPTDVGYYFSVSVSGWKNTGADAGDEFAFGGGFKAH